MCALVLTACQYVFSSVEACLSMLLITSVGFSVHVFSYPLSVDTSRLMRSMLYKCFAVCAFFVMFEVPLTSTSIYPLSSSLICSLLPSPPLPVRCPIRSTSRPVLANHTTSKPGGGVKKVTGVGGTTYEISVWVTDVPRGVGGGGRVTGLLPLTWAGYYSRWQATEKRLFSPATDKRSRPVWYSLCYLCNTTGHSSLLAFQIWTKSQRGHWFIFSQDQFVSI